jgi:hypothetical protein
VSDVLSTQKLKNAGWVSCAFLGIRGIVSEDQQPVADLSRNDPARMRYGKRYFNMGGIPIERFHPVDRPAVQRIQFDALNQALFGFFANGFLDRGRNVLDDETFIDVNQLASGAQLN